MQKDIKLSIVVPVYKSANTLAELHARLGSVAAKHKWMIEVIYVNDASPDSSREIIRSLPPYPEFKLLNLSENRGQSTALLCGMACCKYELIATMDADLQDEPEAIPSLLGRLTPDHDVVFAIRTGSYESGMKLVSSHLFKSLVHLLSAGRIPRFAGLFLIIRREATLPFLQYLPGKPYLLGLIAKHHLKCAAYEVVRKKNHLNETSYSFKKRLQVASRFFTTLNMAPTLKGDEVRKWLEQHTRV